MLGVDYRGADFRFTAPVDRVVTRTPTLGIIGTGKRVGKTSVSAYIARRLKESGLDIVVLAMGRGGPAEPELIHGDRVRLTTDDLLELAGKGVHASSDNYEDAVMSRVTTVGCRRCGGGMAGETFYSNVPEGALLADSLGKDLLVLEGSGSAIPPVFSDASILVVGAGRGAGYVTDFFGPYRLSRADLVVISSAEEPIASAQDIERLRLEIARRAPAMPVVVTTFRPVPLEPIAGRSILFATTAPEIIADKLRAHLEEQHGAHVVAVSTNLSNRSKLREDIARHAGSFDMLVTELKAAAIDVVAAAGSEAGVPTVLCDNVPFALDGDDLGHQVDRVARLAAERGQMRTDRRE
jgi:cyclic 2,3-diphosphoglycerate synthetase